MGYLKPSETDQLFLPSNPPEEPEKFWVRMKKKAEYGDSRAAQNAMMRVNQGSNGRSGQMVTEFEVGAFIGTLTVQLLTEWNLTDENDRVLPITVDNLDRLADEDGEFLSDEAQKRKAGRAAEQQAPFERPSGRPSTATRSKTPK